MKKLLGFMYLFFWLMLTSSITHANQAQVINWLQHTLLQTLSVSYLSTPKDFETFHQQNYTNDAWESITGFLGNYMSIVRANKLTLHPQLNGAAMLLESGVIQNNHFFDGISYWRIRQSIVIPELAKQIDFSIVVIQEPSANHYLIQSMDMLIL